MVHNPTPAAKPASNRLIKDPTAGPVVYFDGAPVHGQINGVIEVTLVSQLLLPTTDGKVHLEIIAAGHLRGSVSAMTALRGAIDGALKMAAGPPIKLAS